MTPMKSHSLIFWFAPLAALVLVLWLWSVSSHEFSASFINYSLILLLMILSLNTYPLLFSGWSASGPYSMMGSLRSVAQTISYEISLAMLMLVISIYLHSLSLDLAAGSKIYFSLTASAPFLLGLWVLSSLAETNRTPFDFAEGESELVSGFNTEYSAAGFALIFMAEYGSIYFLSMLTTFLFYSSSNFFVLSISATLMVFVWVWVRASFPRYRYDLLMSLAWKSILPGALAFSLFVTSVMTT